MSTTTTEALDETRIRQLTAAINRRAPLDGIVLLERESDPVVCAVLERLDHLLVLRLLACLSAGRAQTLLPLLTDQLGEQLEQNLAYPEGSIGRLMEPVPAELPPHTRVADAIEHLRPFAQDVQLIYSYVTDEQRRLVGVVAMRDLLFGSADDTIADVMVTEPFYFTAEMRHDEAMRAVLRRHYPVYPVCGSAGELLGIVRGYALFEQQTYELTAQAGRMVGVEKEEHLGTPLLNCFKFRHPWLQLNLLTAFVAGAVVGVFEGTIAQIVALAAFLPVLAGQSGNTGCQALALTLRAIALGELKPGLEARLVRKELLLGLSNGALVGATAAAAMFTYAVLSDALDSLLLAFIVFAAMVGSCTAAGVAGVIVPLTLRRLGADPATASTIILTTATDVVSMGAMLGLATLLLI